MKVNTELGVNLKTKLRDEVLMIPGKEYRGILRRDVCCEEYGYADSHCTFIESAKEDRHGKRNPHMFVGKYITVTRKYDGTLCLNFRIVKIGKGFDIVRFAFGVAFEIIQALKGLIEKKSGNK